MQTTRSGIHRPHPENHLDLYLEKGGRPVRMSHVKIFRFIEVLSHFSVEKKHTYPFKTDFTASHFLQIILSVAALLFEITFSKFFRSKMTINSDVESDLTKKFNFTYESKCTDFDNAMNQLKLYPINPLHEGGLNILYLEAKPIPSDYDTNIKFIVIRVE